MTDEPQQEMELNLGFNDQYEKLPPDIEAKAKQLDIEIGHCIGLGDDECIQRKTEEQRKLKEPYRKKPKPPPPKNNVEAIQMQAMAKAVCLTPDVCKSPQAPVPYQVYGTADTGQKFSTNVMFNGYPAMKLDSYFARTIGDEGGTGGGMVSGTQGRKIRPTKGSSTYHVNGQPVVRHQDPCTMNDGNCVGEFRFDPPSPPPSSSDGRPPAAQGDSAAQNGQGGEPKGFGDAFMKYSGTAQSAAQAWNRAGQYWNDPSQVWNDTKSLYNSLPSGAQVWDFTKNVGSGAAGIAGKIWNDPVGSAQATAGWVYDKGAAAANAVASTPQKVSNIYQAGGLAGVAGAGLGLGVDLGVNLINPSKKGKAALEGLELLADAARAEHLAQGAHRAEEAAHAAQGAHRAEEAEHEPPRDCRRVKLLRDLPYDDRFRDQKIGEEIFS